MSHIEIVEGTCVIHLESTSTIHRTRGPSEALYDRHDAERAYERLRIALGLDPQKEGT